MSTPTVSTAFECLARGTPLGEQQIRDALEDMTRGAATPAEMGQFLLALKARGETVEDITAGAKLLRSKMVRVRAPNGAVDIVGTGGDGHGTYNVSTCAALVAAGAGLTVAKHGNRSVSSKSGASDVLAALGVTLDSPIETVERCIAEAGVGFLWAPLYHPAMKVWAPIRAELGVRSLFNLLGPLTNPAGVTRQVVGVYAREWVEPVAHVLKNLGSEHAWVVHGDSGLDELSTTGASHVAELKNGSVRTFDVSPQDAGLPVAKLDALKGGDAKENAAALRRVLGGERGAYRDIVVLNTAAALIVGGKAEALAEGARFAEHSIDSGGAADKLEQLIRVSAGHIAT